LNSRAKCGSVQPTSQHSIVDRVALAVPAAQGRALLLFFSLYLDTACKLRAMKTCSECARLQHELAEAEKTRREARQRMESTMDVVQHQRISEEYLRATGEVTRAMNALRGHEAMHAAS
jgi:hypothetical protein